MNSLRANIIANFGGSLVAAVMGLLFIPLYIRFMGIEPYGLVGFYITMQSVLSFLDAGMATTLNREFARLSGTPDATVRMRRLLRTFESIYWTMALVGGAVIMLLARRIAVDWVQPKQLAVEDVAQAVTLMGAAFMVQWPLSLYSGGMQGLQQQVGLNVINAAAATMRAAGVTLVLWLISPTVQAFFAWQILVGLLHTATIGVVLWRRIGGTSGAGFDTPLLRSVFHFAAGMMAIGILSTALTQLDKLILSRVLPLASFGYYAFAGTVAASLYRIVTPIFSAVFPRFSHVVAQGNGHVLASLYHRTAQTITVVVVPAAIFIAFFSHEVLLLWTRDRLVAGNTSAILSLLILGTALNGVLSIPYAVQLAYGWTRVVLVMNIVAVAVLIPTVLLLALRYGARGAAVGWLGYNAAAAIVVPGFLHRRVLRGELSVWYLYDVGAPLAAAALVAFLARQAIPAGAEGFLSMLRLAGAAALVQIAAILAAPDVRRRLVALIQRT